MKNKIIIFISIVIVVSVAVGILVIENNKKSSTILDINNENIIDDKGNETYMIKLNVNDTILNIEPENNSSSFAFIEELKKGEIIINAKDYGNFEKVGDLGFNLPVNDEKITTEVGDLILYQGNKITLYYDTNTWTFTKLGKVKNISQEELKQILGTGDITLKFSLENTKSSKQILFNFETKTVKLNSGYEIPLNGIGTYSLTGDTCYNTIISALNSGVRLIDTAYMYSNEEEIGKAIKDSNVPREDIFITTKLYPNQFDEPEEAIEMALKKLNVDYIDMMLLHHPGSNDVKAYKAMEEYMQQGKIRSIGLSNWYIKELEEFLPQISIMPSLVQNEIHPYYQENDVIPYIQNKGIVVQGWYPLGGRGHTKELLNDNIIVEIANNHNVTSAQVILRWNLQKGVAVIPGSSNPEHIKENTEIYHFKLTNEEVDKINSLNRDEKHDWY